MTIANLRAALPDWAKDLSLNLSSLARTSTLTEQKQWGTFLAAAAAMPTWALLALLAVSALLAAAQVLITQIIRLRASSRITRRTTCACSRSKTSPPPPPADSPGPPAAPAVSGTPLRGARPAPKSRPRIRPRFETDHARHATEITTNPHVKHDRHVSGNENLQLLRVRGAGQRPPSGSR